MNQNDTVARIRATHRSAAKANIRLETLDSWRGICALLVAVMHFPASGPLGESLVVRNAYLFVDYFFVLSGFVIAYGYGAKLAEGVDYLRFVVLRIGRIYPLHVAVLALFVAFEALRWSVPALAGNGPAPFTDGNSPSELLTSLALLNGMGVDSRLTWNGPSWSISAEFWTYILFGGLVVLLGRRSWIALVVAVVIGPVVLYLFSPDYMDATWDLGFVRCVYGFSLGALLYFAAGSKLLSAKAGLAVRPGVGAVAGASALELAAIVMVAAFVAVAGDNAAGIAAPFVFALTLCVFVLEGGMISRLLRTRLFLWLGALSYGIYIVHIFVQARMINLASIVEKVVGLELIGTFEINGQDFYGFGLNGPVFGTLMVAAMIVAVVAVALIAHFVIEKPFQRLSRKLADAHVGHNRTARAVGGAVAAPVFLGAPVRP
ncbi:acyltransferase [Nitratireductor sp. StC3]|uniref:acyltransferase family protein n=1 Tax=Nitratireductor sp. StC3 TaxID=2126741 RepID=UPI001304A4DC|nr:acyltransferase [Nitratireductor sp. StC3]